MFCKNCGSKIPDGNAFCANCGAKAGTGSSVNQKPQSYSQPVQPMPKTPTYTRPGSQPPVYNTQNVRQPKKAANRQTGGIIAIIAAGLAVVLLFEFVFGPMISGRTIFGGQGNSGQAIASGTISQETPTLSENGASLTIYPEFLDEPVEANISKLNSVKHSEALTLDVFDVSADIPEGKEVLMQVCLPYDPKKIPSGQTPEETITVVQFNPATNEWENPDFTIDTDNGTVSFETTHLCNNVEAYINMNAINDPNSSLNTAGGTVDLGNDTAALPIAKLMGKNSADANFGIFEIQEYEGEKNPKRLLDQVTGWSKEKLLENLEEYDPDYSLLVSLETPDDLTRYSIHLLGFDTGVIEYTTQILSDATGSSFYGTTSGVFSNIGMMVTVAQFLENVRSGKSNSESFYQLLKGAVFWKGSSAAAAALGVSAPVMIYGLIGIWTFEQVFMPVEDIFKFTSGSGFYRHKRYYCAMKDYLDRNEDAWYEVVKQVYQKTADTLPEGEDPSKYFKTLMDKEIEQYCQQFFNLEPIVRRERLLHASGGWLYGDDDRIHFSNPGSTSMELYDYKLYVLQQAKSNPKYDTKEFGNLICYDRDTTTGRISDQDNSDNADWYMETFGDNEALQAELVGLYKNEIYSDYINTHLNTVLEIEKNKQWKEVNNSVADLVQELNEVVTIEFVDEEVSDGGVSQYTGYYLIPNIPDYADWKIQIDKNGKAQTQFTRVEYLKNGQFKEYNLYKETDVPKDNKGEYVPIVADPVAVYTIDTNEQNSTIVLSSSTSVAKLTFYADNNPFEDIKQRKENNKSFDQLSYALYEAGSIPLNEDGSFSFSGSSPGYSCHTETYSEETTQGTMNIEISGKIDMDALYTAMLEGGSGSVTIGEGNYKHTVDITRRYNSSGGNYDLNTYTETAECKVTISYYYGTNTIGFVNSDFELVCKGTYTMVYDGDTSTESYEESEDSAVFLDFIPG